MNTPENLRAWLANPQALKPGVRMPDMKLSDDEVDALVSYLVTLR
jgi:cytochrome c oxidase subunit 2